MKRLLSLLGVMSWLAASTFSQDQNSVGNFEFKAGQKRDVDVQRAQHSNKQPLTALGTARAESRPVVYSGFLVDLLKSERPFRMIDPRTPVNSVNDSGNIYTDPQTGKARGFVLFAIKF